MPRLVFTTHLGDAFELSPECLGQISGRHRSSSQGEWIRFPPSFMSKSRSLNLKESPKMDADQQAVKFNDAKTPLVPLQTTVFNISPDPQPSPSTPPISPTTGSSCFPAETFFLPHTSIALVPPGSKSPPVTPPQAVIHENYLGQEIPNSVMAYNEYGELVTAESLRNPPHSTDLTVRQVLRLIKKAFHHDFRCRFDQILIPHGSFVHEDCAAEEAGKRVWKGPLTVWYWRQSSSSTAQPIGTKSEERRVNEANKTPRVLELGCSDGHWCFKLKAENPGWLIEGLDETDHWSCIERGAEYRDLMGSKPLVKEGDDYFSSVGRSHPMFTKRNLNHLLRHEKPLPRNTYGLICGREVFDQIQNYKMFIEDLRQILQPGGVIELSEIDPRPRLKTDDEPYVDDQKSRYETSWADDITSRFQDPQDNQLSAAEALAPGWVRRVNERLKASMRPQDGVPAANLKSWLEGGGFWDVNQTILQLPVGGDTQTGKLMIDYIKYQVGLEDEIPKLKKELPPIEIDLLPSTGFFLNFHIISGRKPTEGRMGDICEDGSREFMTEAKYDSMARFEAEAKSSQWKRAARYRFQLDNRLSGMLGDLSTLCGGPDHVGTHPSSTGETSNIASPVDVSPIEVSSLDLSPKTSEF
ncbi:hypothetical protein BP6252_01498 [Coleophoma cylindrospora]|uniref:Methyltransferase domain-containing protein n=1 Tax=Coleophoma cylindrospora TaxID=1849047 RepID=A0A3D8ST34_9HELO|nr:hypothetical protein BP6252_01498 [Coleophoma cylindrospora]